MTQEIEAKLSHLNEAKEELRLLQKHVVALESDILRTIQEEECPPSAVNFSYAGGYYRANINIGRVMSRAPNQKETIEAIRKLLPDGEQTTKAAEAHYQSLYQERPIRDSVTIKAVTKPEDEHAQKVE